MAYVTVAQVKSWLDISATGDDALLTTLIERAQAMVERHTGRVFEAAADTEKTFDAVEDVEGNYLYVDADLCAVTTVVNGDGTTVTAYVTEPRRSAPYYALKLTSGAWTFDDTPENAISVTGRWAYSVTAPADIQQATVRLVAFMYRQRDTGADADRVQTLEGGVTILPAAIPRDVLQMLEPYRRLV